MVNLLNSKMVIIYRVELVSPNIERKHLKTNKYFKNRQAGNSKIGIMNTNSWGLRQKWSATAASGTRVVYSVPEKGVSGTEYPFRTGKACFLHRMPQKMRRVPQCLSLKKVDSQQRVNNGVFTHPETVQLL